MQRTGNQSYETLTVYRPLLNGEELQAQMDQISHYLIGTLGSHALEAVEPRYIVARGQPSPERLEGYFGTGDIVKAIDLAINDPDGRYVTEDSARPVTGVPVRNVAVVPDNGSGYTGFSLSLADHPVLAEDRAHALGIFGLPGTARRHVDVFRTPVRDEQPGFQEAAGRIPHLLHRTIPALGMRVDLGPVALEVSQV